MVTTIPYILAPRLCYHRTSKKKIVVEWPTAWSGDRLLFHCDEAIVHVWQPGCSCSVDLMHLLRALLLQPSVYIVTVLIRHIPDWRDSAPWHLKQTQTLPTGPASQGVATSTRRTYKAGVQAFTTFCNHYSINPSTLLLSIAVTYQTIKVYIAAPHWAWPPGPGPPRMPTYWSVLVWPVCHHSGWGNPLLNLSGESHEEIPSCSHCLTICTSGRRDMSTTICFALLGSTISVWDPWLQ